MAVLWEERQATKHIRVNAGMTCDNCGAEVKPVFEDADLRAVQPDDALVIKLIGGYGMYFDDIFGQPDNLIFCKACADKLCEAFPCFKKAVDGE